MRRFALFCLLALILSACSQEAPSDKPADPAPTPTSSSATAATPAATAIPDGFPLSDEMSSETSDAISVSPQSVGMRALDLCGRKPLRGLKPADRLAAEASGNEYSNTRDLMLFADADQPAAVLADIRSSAAACPADALGPGSRLLTEVRDSTLGPDASVLVHTYEQDGKVGIGAEIIDVVQVGRALLVTSSYAEWDPATNLDEGIADEAERLAEIVAAMSIFEDASPGAARAPADTGYDAITFSRSYTTGLGASAFQVIRVGQGILLTHVYGEGTLDAIGPTLRRQTRLGRDLAGDMCVFARAGC